jgi:hypothetical protein
MSITPEGLIRSLDVWISKAYGNPYKEVFLYDAIKLI